MQVAYVLLLFCGFDSHHLSATAFSSALRPLAVRRTLEIIDKWSSALCQSPLYGKVSQTTTCACSTHRMNRGRAQGRDVSWEEKKQNLRGRDVKKTEWLVPLKTFPVALVLIAVVSGMPQMVTAVAHATPITTTVTLSSTTSPDTSFKTAGTASDKVKSVAYPGMPRTAPIMDYSGVISKDSIERMLSKIDQETTSQVQIVVVDQISGVSSPKQLATRLFNEWRLGSRDRSKKNHAVLVLAVLEERRIEIEIGRDLNPYMDADWCSRLLKRTAIPNFRRQNYDRGLEATLDGIIKQLRNVESGVVQLRPPTGPSPDIFTYVVSWGLVGFLIVAVLDANAYPKRDPCLQCGASYRTWQYEGYWKTTLKATDQRPGREEMACACQECGYESTVEKKIPQYDGQTTGGDYYYNDDSSGGGGGGSDGGGGGASW